MAKVKNKQTGAVTEVNADQIGELAASGEYLIEPGTSIPVVDSSGNVGMAPVDALPTLLQSGSRFASGGEVAQARASAKYGTIGQQALTAVEGAARGATVGLSDVAAEALGADMADMRGRQEENTGAAIGGELVGAGAPLLLSGGASTGAQGAGLLARAGRAASTAARVVGAPVRGVARVGEAVASGVRAVAGEGVAARALGTGLAGAAEGAFVGAGQSLSHASLNDEALTGEQLMADMGNGALWGGGLGVAGSLAVSGVSRVAESGAAAMNRALRSEAASKFANRQAFSAAARGSKKKRFAEQASDFMGGPDGAEAVGEIALRRGIVSQENRSARAIHDAARREQTVAGHEINTILSQADDLGARVSAADVMRRIDGEVIAPLRAIGGATSKRLANKVQAEFTTFLERQSVRVQRQEKYFTTGRLGEQIERTRNIVDVVDVPISTRDLQQWRVKLDAQLKLTKKEGQYGTADALLGARKIIEDEIGNAIVSKAPNMAGAYQAAKREYSGIKLIADSSKDTIKTDQANRLMSRTDYVTMGGAASAMGASPAALAAALITGTANKVLREQGSGAAAGTLYKAIQRARGVASEMDTSVSRAVDLANGVRKKTANIAPIIAASGGGSASEAFDRKAARVRELAADPMRMHAATAAAIGHAPTSRVQTEMAQTSARGVAFLASKLPARLQQSDPFGRTRDRQKVSTHDALKFLRYANAVEDPKAVLAGIGNGNVTRAEMEALKSVYPKMHDAVVSRIVKGIAEAKEAPSLDTLTHLSIVTGVPLHPSLSPANIAAAQAIYAQGPESPANKPFITRGNATIGKNGNGSASASERIESGGT